MLVNFPNCEKILQNKNKQIKSTTHQLEFGASDAGDSQPQQMGRVYMEGHLYPGDKRDRDRLEELEADSESSPDFEQKTALT